MRKIKNVEYYIQVGNTIQVINKISKLESQIKHNLQSKKSFVVGIFDSECRIYKDELFGYEHDGDKCYHYNVRQDSYNMTYKKYDYIKFVKQLIRRFRPIMLRYAK